MFPKLKFVDIIIASYDCSVSPPLNVKQCYVCLLIAYNITTTQAFPWHLNFVVLKFSACTGASYLHEFLLLPNY